jgi:hypothetical protein
MEKFNTESKLIVDREVVKAVKKIKSWTRKELKVLLSTHRKPNQKPLIVPVATNLFIVGHYAIQQINNYWHMIYRYNDIELQFVNQQAALFYAICNQTYRYTTADQLLKYDQEINRLIIEVERLKYRIQQCGKKRMPNNLDLYNSRYNESLVQLRHRRHLLEKTLKLAKYSNH